MEIFVIRENLDDKLRHVDFETIGVIDSYKSVIWNTRYSSPGDFELYVDATKDLFDLFVPGHFLVRSKDIREADEGLTYENVMVIEDIELSTDEENGDFILVTGNSLKNLLNQYCVTWEAVISGNWDYAIRYLIDQTIYFNMDITSDSTTSNGKFMIAYEPPEGYGGEVNLVLGMEALGPVIEANCMKFGMGYDVKIVNNQVVFYTFMGANRSYSQNINPYVVFSPEYENLLASNYKIITSTYKNKCSIRGTYPIPNYAITSYTDDSIRTSQASKLLYRNMVIEDSGISANLYDDRNDYISKLFSRAIQEVHNHTKQVSFEGQVETNLTYKFGEDYFLGDIVQIENEYGIKAAARIIEVIESEDENGIHVIPTFSTTNV